MPAERQALDTIRTTADAGRTLRSFGPGWDAAVADGVDVALLLENLALPPRERLRILDEQNRLLDALRPLHPRHVLRPDLGELVDSPERLAVEAELRAIRDVLRGPQ